MNQREASRQEWRTFGEAATVDEIQCGALQRIADATEKMAASYDQLRRDRDWWKTAAESRGKALSQTERRVTALRGVITRMKRKA